MQSWPSQEHCASEDKSHYCVASAAYQESKDSTSLNINGEFLQSTASAEDFTPLAQTSRVAFQQNSLIQQLSTVSLRRPIIWPDSQPRQLRQKVTYQILTSQPFQSAFGGSERRIEQYSHACYDTSRDDFGRTAGLTTETQQYQNAIYNGGQDSSRAKRRPAEKCDSASERDNGTPEFPGPSLRKHHERAYGETQSHVRSQASEYQIACSFTLDGVADGTVVKSREKEGRKDLVNASPISVTDRIRAIEKKDGQNSTLPRHPMMLQKTSVTKNVVSPKDASFQKSNIPMVFPLHVRKFTRRTSSAAPIRPETPLYHAQPNNDSNIHSPQARRDLQMPELSPSDTTQEQSDSPIAPYMTPPETLDTTRGDHDSSIARNMSYGRRQSKNFALRPTSRPSERGRQRTSPASFLMGTKDNCVRHGRRPALDTRFGQTKIATRDMVEKSNRTGAYRPTGLLSRRQMEATSPWAFNRNLTLEKGSNNVCPDCLAETNMKRREMSHTTEMEGSTSTVRKPGHHSREDVSWLGEIAENDLHASGVPPVWIPRITPRDSQGHEIHKQATQEDAKSWSVVERHLGDHLDAAIFGCGGDLKYVVLNNKFGSPPSDSLEKLAKNMHEVTKALTMGHAKHTFQANRSLMERTLMLDLHQATNQESIPQLMKMIDEAVNGLDQHDKNNNDEDHWPALVQDYAFGTSHGIDSQSLIQSEDVDAVFGGISPGARLVHRQTFHSLEQLQKQHAQAPPPPHPDVHATYRSWWWPISRHKSREPSPHPTSGTVPVITATQPSQCPSLGHAHMMQSQIATKNPAQCPTSPSPKSPVANCAAGLLPTPLASKPVTEVVPPAIPTQPKDGSSSTVHLSTAEVMDSSNQPHIDSQRGPEVADKPCMPLSKTPPPITRAANPYHHAPSTPRDLHSAN